MAKTFTEEINLAHHYLLVSGTYFTTPSAANNIAWSACENIRARDVWNVTVKERDVTITKVEEYNEKDELQQIILTPDELIHLTEILAEKLTEIEQNNYSWI